MKIKKNTIIILSALLIRLLIVVLIFNSFWTEIASVNPYVVEKNIVYVPETTPRKFHYDLVGVFFGNEHFEYWKIKPNKDEQEKLLQDIQNGNWSLMSWGEHSSIIVFDYIDGFFDKRTKTDPFSDNATYICVYNDNKDEIITDEYESSLCSHLMVFIYDSDDNFYYCSHVSM